MTSIEWLNSADAVARSKKAYVDRAETEYGPGEAIKRDTRRHMQKIRRALNEHKK